jgi:hypothetical protein
MGWFEDAVRGGAIAGPWGAINQGFTSFMRGQDGGGGGSKQQMANADMGSYVLQRNSDIAQGRDVGKQIFYSPEMQEMAARNKDLSKGYTGEELGALRQQAQNQIQGQRAGYLRSLQSKAGKGGIGGARAAAMQASADRGFAGAGAEAERKMLVDNANLIRQSNKDYQDFALRQRFGELGTGLAYGQLGAGDRASANQAVAANNAAIAAGKKGLLGMGLEAYGIDGLF